MIKLEKKPAIPPKEFWEDERWAYSHYQDLASRYPDRWVAVIDKKVVSAGTNLGRVIEKAEKKAGTREFPLLFIEGGAHVYKD